MPTACSVAVLKATTQAAIRDHFPQPQSGAFLALLHPVNEPADKTAATSIRPRMSLRILNPFPGIEVVPAVLGRRTALRRIFASETADCWGYRCSRGVNAHNVSLIH